MAQHINVCVKQHERARACLYGLIEFAVSGSVFFLSTTMLFPPVRRTTSNGKIVLYMVLFTCLEKLFVDYSVGFK